MTRRSRFAILLLAPSLPVACAGARSEAGVDQETEAFYAAFGSQVQSEVRALGADEVEQLRDIMPLAEVEGATDDVLEVI
ncbi:MAG TPA: hypothetical protein VJP59_00290, partial [Gemmatimonadota bacterium]|nr:hypothetical protein [Gemmatimonadota bacterium]